MSSNSYLSKQNKKQLPSFLPFNNRDQVLDKLATCNNGGLSLQPVVIALAVGYSTRQLKPFILSLRKYNKNCRLVIFGANLSQSTRKFLQLNGTELIEFDRNAFGKKFNIHNSRFISILEWLLQSLNEGLLPEKVFLTDIRDVVFQSDPFEAPISGIEFFLEHHTPNIRDCPANSSWTRRCFGEEEIRAIGDNVISCCGTIFSTGKAAIEYLLLMQDLLLSFPPEVQQKFCDQAIHNHILYHNLMPNITAYKNGDKVLTVGYVPRQDIVIADNKVEYGPLQIISPVLHQWDRNPSISGLVLDLYEARPGYIEQMYLTYRNKTRKTFTLNNLRKIIKQKYGSKI
jgi:hypothetical protein